MMDIVKCRIGRSRPSRLADDRQMDEWMDRFSLNAKTTFVCEMTTISSVRKNCRSTWPADTCRCFYLIVDDKD
ncbi:hypothetical protein OUZ56_026852 [Daphnia magna]|uniref:Uncharacterized protein n=1 Tax=Daphnia magna TaxID=35525 RepID=A0ABQ9ZN70_9CRUS|nr:hypothetical protein OUZ56_026852 [Daphnia magna]